MRGKPADALTEGPHAALQHFEIEAVGEVGGAAVVHLQVRHAFGEELAAFGDLLDGGVQLAVSAFGDVALVEGVAQTIEGFGQIGLQAFEAEHGAGERMEPARFDE